MTDLRALADRAYEAVADGEPLVVTYEECHTLRNMVNEEWDDAVRDAWRAHDNIAYNLPSLRVVVR